MNTKTKKGILFFVSIILIIMISLITSSCVYHKDLADYNENDLKEHPHNNMNKWEIEEDLQKRLERH
jgi:hypothetical protein